MKFQVQYPSGPTHEVELEGTIAILGRDPSCDLVLNDVKCSRRHAVLEAGPQGLAIRDTGSANGVFVNNKKVERAALNDGDVVRLGDVLLTVLPEDMPGTLVMGPEDIEPMPAAKPDRPAARPIPAAPAAPAASLTATVPPVVRPRPAQRAGAPPQHKTETSPPWSSAAPARPAALLAEAQRPVTLTVLAILWMICVLIYPVAALAAARRAGGMTMALAVAAGVGLAGLSAGMAFGLWTRQAWARVVQIVVAALGLLVCPFTLASAAVLTYMLRPSTAERFSGARPAADPLRPDAAELTFTGIIMATVILGTILAAVTAFLLRPAFAPPH